MIDPVVEEKIQTKEIQETGIEKNTKKQKESIIKTIGTTIWLWIEELGNAIWGESKKIPNNDNNHYQVNQELEKIEEKQIKKRGIHQD